MKKAQLAEQPFIYILGIVTVILILLFGARSITKLREEAELVQIATFVNDFSRIIETYYNLNVGSFKELSLSIPSQIKMICFTNPNQPLTAEVNPELEFLLTGKENVYFFNGKLGPRTILHLEANQEENPLCIQTQGRLIANIETKARERQVYVEISR